MPRKLSYTPINSSLLGFSYSYTPKDELIESDTPLRDEETQYTDNPDKIDLDHSIFDLPANDLKQPDQGFLDDFIDQYGSEGLYLWDEKVKEQHYNYTLVNGMRCYGGKPYCSTTGPTKMKCRKCKNNLKCTKHFSFNYIKTE